MMLIAALLLLTAQTVPAVDPIGNWLIDEGKLKSRARDAGLRAAYQGKLKSGASDAGWRTAYARYRAAGGTATFVEWQHLAVRGAVGDVRRVLDVRRCPDGQGRTPAAATGCGMVAQTKDGARYVWNGTAWLPDPAAPLASRSASGGRAARMP